MTDAQYAEHWAEEVLGNRIAPQLDYAVECRLRILKQALEMAGTDPRYLLHFTKQACGVSIPSAKWALIIIALLADLQAHGPEAFEAGRQLIADWREQMTIWQIREEVREPSV